MNQNDQSHIFVVGDIHGAYKALKQCLERSEFNFEKDVLISLGDICDGWPDVYEIFEDLLQIKNLILILGNHDYWALEWMKTGEVKESWLRQGGKATIQSYHSSIPETHIKLLSKACYYYEDNNKLFIHGGFDLNKKITEQDTINFLWDRSLIYSAFRHHNSQISQLTGYNEIYVGHTPTLNFGKSTPMKVCEIWMMDTGAGWPGGILSMMNINTGELFQSDVVQTLYPGIKGRG